MRPDGLAVVKFRVPKATKMYLLKGPSARNPSITHVARMSQESRKNLRWLILPKVQYGQYIGTIYNCYIYNMLHVYGTDIPCVFLFFRFVIRLTGIVYEPNRVRTMDF